MGLELHGEAITYDTGTVSLSVRWGPVDGISSDDLWAIKDADANSDVSAIVLE
jgi:hypothetical protein